ncbi:MAG: tetratricopeptide repeat protein [Crocinitomicaceae bacterium]
MEFAIVRFADCLYDSHGSDGILRSKGYQKGVADCCRILGYCYWRFSDYSLSLSQSLKGLEIYQRIGDIQGEADILNNIGAVYMFQNDNEKRLEVNLRCKELRGLIGDLEGVASSEGNIGETYLEMGDYANANKCFESVLSDPNASPQGMAWAYHNIGRIKSLQKEFEEAYTYYKKGLDLSESVSYNVLITDSYLIITELFLEQKMYDKAISQAEKALEVSRKIGAKEGEKKALYYLSKIYEQLGQFEASLKYHKDYHSKDMEISRDTEIERLKTTQLKAAFDKIEEQKNELIDSIRYAERIQNAVLTRDQNQKLVTKYFVTYQAKDIVSGDFYWYYEKDHYFYLCVADCTGHGVPGALLTMLGTTYLNDIVTLNEDITPAFVLDRLRHRLIHALSKKSNDDGTKDGMDISLIRFNRETLSAEWAGAYNPIWVIRKNKTPLNSSTKPIALEGEQAMLYELKGDKIPVGDMEVLKPFSEHRIQFELGDLVYLFSDGFADQFGGKYGKKYRSGQLKEFLLQIHATEIHKQGELLQSEFNSWKRNLEQVDDVCIIGIEI